MQQIERIVVVVVLLFGCEAATLPPLPCKNTNGSSCGYHVFRVSLSSRPEEENATLTVKQRRKYGSNVYVPTGDADSFNLNLAQEVVEKMPPNIDPRVKDRINDLEFVMKQIDATAVWVRESEPLPKNFQPLRKTTNENTSSTTPPPSPTAQRPATGENKFPLMLTALLIVIGILLGILGTCGVFVLVTYRKKPKIDRSKMVIHRRPTEMERAMLDRNKRYYDQTVRVHQIQRISSAQSNSSTRTPRPMPPPPRRQRREDTLPSRAGGTRTDSERLSEM